MRVAEYISCNIFKNDRLYFITCIFIRTQNCFRLLAFRSIFFRSVFSGSDISSRNKRVSRESSSIRYCSSNTIRIQIDRLLLLKILFCCTIVRSNVLENSVEYKRIILQQTCRITTSLILISNRNARNPIRYFNINFYFSIDLFSICTVLAILYCSCINNACISFESDNYRSIAEDITETRLFQNQQQSEKRFCICLLKH